MFIREAGQAKPLQSRNIIDRLRSFCDEDEAIELTASIGLFNDFDRFNNALQIKPTKPGEDARSIFIYFRMPDSSIQQHSYPIAGEVALTPARRAGADRGLGVLP
jgi:hypothetical protein